MGPTLKMAPPLAWPANAPVAPLPPTAELPLKVLPVIEGGPKLAMVPPKALPAESPVVPLPATAELPLMVLSVMVRKTKLDMMAPPINWQAKTYITTYPPTDEL